MYTLHKNGLLKYYESFVFATAYYPCKFLSKIIGFNSITRCAYALRLCFLPLIDVTLRLIVAVINVLANIKNTLEYCGYNSLPAHQSKLKQCTIILPSLKHNITLSEQSRSFAYN